MKRMSNVASRMYEALSTSAFARGVSSKAPHGDALEMATVRGRLQSRSQKIVSNLDKIETKRPMRHTSPPVEFTENPMSGRPTVERRASRLKILQSQFNADDVGVEA